MARTTQKQAEEVSDSRRAVVITTTHKGVFFGYLTGSETGGGETVRLEQARMCVYWTPETHGVLGLASSGPDKGCRIGPAVPSLLLHGVTAVADTSPEAAEKWERGEWQ